MRTLRIQISASVYFCWAASILMLPVNWLLGWLIAVLIHETGHLAALKFSGVSVSEIRIGLFGVMICSGSMTATQELLCAAAGPVCSFLLIGFWGWFPAASIIGLVQGMFNVLPIYPMDGGRMVQAVREIMHERADERKIPCKERYERVQ